MVSIIFFNILQVGMLTLNKALRHKSTKIGARIKHKYYEPQSLLQVNFEGCCCCY